MDYIYQSEMTEVVIIGGGHAGCEAALACARMGVKTTLMALNLDSIAMMPCNPNIGGTSKGHLVREIDALGGEMGKNIDKSFIQSRMLNTGKGPAVHSLRAQADKSRYHEEMKKTLENTKNLKIRQADIQQIVFEDNEIKGVISEARTFYPCRVVVICSGTYLNARCLYGETIVYSGPNGLKASTELSKSLKSLGISLMRFKTGTPARIDMRSVDFAKMSEQTGDETIVPFSFDNKAEDIQREQISCWLTYTNLDTHEIIKRNIHRSPMYAGVIEGTGTRYCPSIEDKIVRFADKERHQIFIEPEGENTNEMYVQGMSTSLPEDVQVQMYRSIAGLENCEIVRNGYAIEYDCLDATQLYPTLEFKKLPGLYSAGQFNGSSGYEEAAAQGLIAGINAARKILKQEAVIIDRSEGYIGVLIDDLVIKGSKEPYRMMTSRAEYRLLLRQDNADLRLTEKGYEAGLVSEDKYQRFVAKRELIDEEIKRVSGIVVPPTQLANNILKERDSTLIATGIKLIELMKRPELDYTVLAPLDTTRPDLPQTVQEQVNIAVKYDGYIKRQMVQVEQFKKLEKKLLPADINYEDVPSLRLEARQKLKALRPVNIGQASRITGVSPADISVLTIFLEKNCK